jgi:hypothetical protein
MENNNMQGICKIGCVRKLNKTSHDRAKELFTTSCATPFTVVFDIKVKNPYKYEKRIHELLKENRVNKKREFFNCKPIDIIHYFNIINLVKDENDLLDFPKGYLNIYKLNDSDSNLKLNNILDAHMLIIRTDTKNIFIKDFNFDDVEREYINLNDIDFDLDLVNITDKINEKYKNNTNKTILCELNIKFHINLLKNFTPSDRGKILHNKILEFKKLELLIEEKNKFYDDKYDKVIWILKICIL